jgi:hypothetical protein
MFLVAINKSYATASEDQSEMKGRQCYIGRVVLDMVTLCFCRGSLHPQLDAAGICEAGQLALSIEEHNQHGAQKS